MTRHMEGFQDLPIVGGFVREFRGWLSKTVMLSMLVPPAKDDEPQVTRDYELHFGRVGAIQFNVKAFNCLEIVSLETVDQSTLLDEYNSRRGVRGPDLAHFCVHFDEGRLDVLANTFALIVVDEMPFFSGPP
jgi:hypothetical protein